MPEQVGQLLHKPVPPSSVVHAQIYPQKSQVVPRLYNRSAMHSELIPYAKSVLGREISLEEIAVCVRKLKNNKTGLVVVIGWWGSFLNEHLSFKWGGGRAKKMATGRKSLRSF